MRRHEGMRSDNAPRMPLEGLLTGFYGLGHIYPF
jgi:hypothetical protein